MRQLPFFAEDYVELLRVNWFMKAFRRQSFTDYLCDNLGWTRDEIQKWDMSKLLPLWYKRYYHEVP